jgi:hypothetical protein
VSDLFFVCRMRLQEQDAVALEKSTTACPHEIAAMQWMSVQDYCDQERWQQSPVYQELNRAILNASQHAHFHHATLPLGFISINTNNRGTNIEIPYTKVSTKLDYILAPLLSSLSSLSLSLYIYMIDSLVSHTGISAATTAVHCIVPDAIIHNSLNQAVGNPSTDLP